MRCPHCDSKLTKKNKFCPECGMAVVFEEKTNSQASTPKGIRALIVIGILLLVAIISVGTLFALGGIEGIKEAVVTGKTPTTTAFSSDPDAIAIASKSVVKLNCYDRSGDLYATGSGFACFEDNVIVTNYHVIEDGVYSIEASTEDGTKFDIKYILAVDEDRDIAILSTATSHNLTLLKPGNSNTLQKGEKVVAIGSPLGLLNSVSTGVFSGYTDENGMDVLQFTASISSGSSGGALFNDAGEVLGITFASYEAGQNLNLAIPITQVERVWNSTTHTKMTVAEFYNSQIPVYSLDFVMDHYADLCAETFYVDCWVSTFKVSSTGWLFCTSTASDVHYPTDNEDDNGYEYDRIRHLHGQITRAHYRYNMHGFTPLRAPTLSRGDHIRLLCVGVEEPIYLDGEMIVGPMLIASNIEKIN